MSTPHHRVTGDRSQRSRRWMDPETRVGHDFAHALVDDHSRLAYVELHDDERAQTVTGFVYRPQTNGKVERFHQTMGREWAYGMAYRSHRHRTPPCHTGLSTTTSADPTAR